MSGVEKRKGAGEEERKIDNCCLTPSQPRRSYQGEGEKKRQRDRDRDRDWQRQPDKPRRDTERIKTEKAKRDPKTTSNPPTPHPTRSDHLTR